jgi:signal peptidase I
MVFNGPAMQPAIMWGAEITIQRTNTTQRGEIVCFRHYRPDGNRSDEYGNYFRFVSRVIALGGDTISFVRLSDSYSWEAVVYLNGVLLDETEYLAVEASMFFGSSQQNGFIKDGDRYSLTIQAGYMFVMGDSRGTLGNMAHMANDSRSWGAININRTLVGRVIEIRNP